jgi:hypothetical protein
VCEDGAASGSSAGWQLVAAEGFALLDVVVCEALDSGDLTVTAERGGFSEAINDEMASAVIRSVEVPHI